MPHDHAQHEHHDDHEHNDHDAGHWNDRYAAGRVWGTDANPVLVAEVAEIAGARPGRALDAGCGEGADVRWLAARGWDATGLDFSAVAVENARSIAAEQGLAATFEVADLTAYEPSEQWDLVTSHYLHVPDLPAVVTRLSRAVAPGGTLLIVGHHPADAEAGIPRPGRAKLFTPADLVAAVPDDWEVVVAEDRPRTSRTPEGETLTVTDAVVRVRRPGSPRD